MKKRKIVKRKKNNDGPKKVTVLLETQMVMRFSQEVYVYKNETLEQNIMGMCPWVPSGHLQGQAKTKVVKIIMSERTGD